jgi:hypothetical protein
VKAINGAAVLALAIELAACSPSAAPGTLSFGASGATNYLKGGEYAVSVTNECGSTVVTVAGQIEAGRWSYPLLNGTPIAIPRSGKYTVVDPIGDIGNTPACELALTVNLTPVKG